MSNKEKFINFNLGTENYEGVDERWCKKYSKYQRHLVDDDNVEKFCKKKCNELGEDCNAIAIGKGTRKGKKFNCTTYKNCTLSKEGSSISWTKNGKYEFFKQTGKKESVSLHVVFLMILVFQTFLMLAYGAMLLSKSFRKNM
jgi:hypothetical protein